MRVALLADVHANSVALRAVLEDADRRGARDVIVAGDLIGYGPDPEGCVALLAERGAVAVAGNHELRVLDRLPASRFSALANRSHEVTCAGLAADTRDYLESLPLARSVGRFHVAHGSLSDPEEYVTRRSRARELLGELTTAAPGADVLVLGHTHHQWRVGAAGGRPDRDGAPPRRAQLVNPGSVGQSRQRERRPLARYALVDLAGSGVTFRAIPYDVGATVAHLRELGLPSSCVHDPPAFTRPLRVTAYRTLRALNVTPTRR